MDLSADIKQRLRRVKAEMENQGVCALLIGRPKNIFYFTGKDTGRLLITEDEAILWIKDLYQELYAGEYPAEVEIREYEKDCVKEYVNSAGIKKLGLENINFLSYKKLLEELTPELLPGNIPERLRSIKTDYEIMQLKKAGNIAKKGMEKAYEVVVPGAMELDAVAEIEAEIRRNGSETPPFEEGMLLASGKAGADIHAHASNRSIAKNSLVVVDLGARYNGYHSDMTRTIEAGRPGKKEKEVAEFVAGLQEEATDFVEVGMNAAEVHSFVEKKMEKKGFTFYHSTGHGIGLDIHELPNIGPGSEDILKEGMAFTIEPGVYLAGRFGVRFEDSLLLKKNKKVLLTR